MESVDSPWGDIVRTVTSWQACSSCSWDTSTSTLPAVGEATSIIYREEGKQGRDTKIAKLGIRRDSCRHPDSIFPSPFLGPPDHMASAYKYFRFS